MGRIIKPEAIKDMTVDTKRSWVILEIKLYMILGYLNSLIESVKLKGKAAEGFKMQMKNHKSVINAILNEIGKGLEYCEALENEVGFVDLVEDEIIEQIHSLRNLNEMLSDDIAELRSKPHDILYRIMEPVNYEQVCLNYEHIKARNELLIEALERQLQKIDDIEAKVKCLFSTDGIDSINSAIRALDEGFSETDFVPITYPSICAITKLQSLGDKDPDPRGIRTGIDERFITVLNDDGTVMSDGKGFGGAQKWLDPKIGDHACGIVAAVNTYLYITGQTTITKSQYIKLCEQFCEEHPINTALIGTIGAIPPSMEDYIEDRCREHGLSINAGWNYLKGTDQYDTMKHMLANNIPVIWGLHSQEACKADGSEENMLKLYKFKADGGMSEESVKSHYVVATAIYEQEQADGSYRRMVEVSSWGERYYIDYDEYLDFAKANGIDKIKNNVGSNIMEIKIK
ncbi:MAG: hypothetical protein NC428_14630 [Clostridium sp.]|nr:hypothetical protein [Clostridium sp.]